MYYNIMYDNYSNSSYMPVTQECRDKYKILVQNIVLFHKAFMGLYPNYNLFDKEALKNNPIVAITYEEGAPDPDAKILYLASPRISIAALVFPSSTTETISLRISSMVIPTSIPKAVESPTAGSASIASIFLSG